MVGTGLVSVSFRGLTPEAVASAAERAGLKFIEWGSDIHAPWEDAQKLEEVCRAQEAHGIRCGSYGTYFRLAVTPLEELLEYIRGAKKLGTTILRLWCGTKKQTDCSEEERAFLLDQCRQAAKIGEREGVTLCLECHRNSYTETKEGALEVMEAVNSPAFRMYWQPNQWRTVSENLEYVSCLKKYISHVHVFQWKQKQRFPLRDGLQEWKGYLHALSGQHMLLLEFMPDDDVASLPAEAEALRMLTGGEQ